MEESSGYSGVGRLLGLPVWRDTGWSAWPLSRWTVVLRAEVGDRLAGVDNAKEPRSLVSPLVVVLIRASEAGVE